MARSRVLHGLRDVFFVLRQSVLRNGITPSKFVENGSPENLVGGKSWNMKSHFQRSDGFDPCNQWRAATGGANASDVIPPNPFTSGKRAAISARTWAALA